MDLRLHDVLELKKEHPCGSKRWQGGRAVRGACFITEGVVPFVLRDPLHVIPSCMVGASLAAALSMLFGCAVPAPHGGMFLLPLNPHPFRYLLALLMGSLLTAVTLAVLRRKYPPKDEEQPTN